MIKDIWWEMYVDEDCGGDGEDELGEPGLHNITRVHLIDMTWCNGCWVEDDREIDAV